MKTNDLTITKTRAELRAHRRNGELLHISPQGEVTWKPVEFPLTCFVAGVGYFLRNGKRFHAYDPGMGKDVFTMTVRAASYTNPATYDPA